MAQNTQQFRTRNEVGQTRKLNDIDVSVVKEQLKENAQ